MLLAGWSGGSQVVCGIRKASWNKLKFKVEPEKKGVREEEAGGRIRRASQAEEEIACKITHG